MTGRVEQLAKSFAIDIRWRAFPLHPETPPEGQRLEELFRTTPERVAAMVSQLRFKALELGLPFGARSMTYNSRLAQELGLWAEDQGAGKIFHDLAFRAYFSEGVNLAEHEVLLTLAEQAGLARVEAAKVIDSRSFAAAVDADWALSRQLGITAVPTFVLDTQQLVGAQEYHSLVDLMRNNGVKER